MPWLVWKGRLKTTDFLKKIGVVDANVDSSCVLCRLGEEYINHIMLHGPFVWKIGSNIIKWWGVQWVIPGSVECLLQWWSGWKFKKWEMQMRKVIPLAVFWSVWKHRNDVIFNLVQPDMEELCDLIKVRVAMWMKEKLVGREYSINQFVSNLQQIRLCIK